jgi:hypothetical protein
MVALWQDSVRVSGQWGLGSSDGSLSLWEEHTMLVEDKLKALGLELPDLDEQYRRNASGARFISHYAVQNILYL